jgi:tetratricopeptide (TPR) repeat protein
MSESKELYQQAMNKGHSAAWEQDWEQAAGFYQQALDEIPDNPQALASFGLALFELQQFSEALKVYARAATLSVEDPIPVEKVSQLYERLGNPENAVKSARRAADLYLKKRDSEKAIENLVRATRLNPEGLAARTRLAMIYEGLGRKQQAVAEYISLASIIQHAGDSDKALQAINHAIAILPGSTEAHQALKLLQDSKPLAKPVHSSELSNEIHKIEHQQSEDLEVSTKETNSLDPITEAQNKSLTILAGLLFEPGDENSYHELEGDQGLMDYNGFEGGYSIEPANRSKTLRHLSQAVNLQTQGIIDKAAEELELAVEAGINHPAALFNLGLLKSKSLQMESALRVLQQVIEHPDFALGAYLLRANLYRQMDRIDDAAIEYLEALRLADSQVVDANQVDELLQLYDTLIERQAQQRDPQVKERLCDSISEILLRKDWQKCLVKARQGLSVRGRDGGLVPLGEIIIEVSSLEVIETMKNIHRLASAGHLRSAMEEVYFALNFGPMYLPLHDQIGDLLLQQERLPEALAKFTLIARTYGARGDGKRAAEMLRKILQLAPTDLITRELLIQQLFESGQVNEAVSECLELGEFYINQAELKKARFTYSEALVLAKKANVGSYLITQILHQMADIDMQSLNWQQALQIYTQIRRLQPGDEQARINLIGLNLRIGKEAQALEELDSYIEYLLLIEEVEKAITFLENLLRDNPERKMIRRRLADLYGQNGRIKEAITQLNAIGQAYLKTGNREAAVEVVKAVLALNPPNRADFERLLARLQAR